MNEVIEEFGKFNKMCGKYDKAVRHLDERLKRRWKTLSNWVEGKHERITSAMKLATGRKMEIAIRQEMTEVIERVLSSMKSIMKIEFKLTQICFDARQAAEKMKQNSYNIMDSLLILFDERQFALSKKGINALLVQLKQIVEPWETKGESTRKLINKMTDCRLENSDNYPASRTKFEKLMKHFLTYKSIEIAYSPKDFVVEYGTLDD